MQCLVNSLKKLQTKGIRVKYDNAENKRPGFKFADYELKGVPVRLVMGGRDLENGTIEVMRRDTLEKKLSLLKVLKKRSLLCWKKSKKNILSKRL